MLHNKHFKILNYEADSNKVFPGLSTPLKGGVAISYYDDGANFGEIDIFTKFEDLNSILRKVLKNSFKSFEDIISSPLSYRVSDLMVKENPDLIPRLRSSAFTKLSRIFFSSKPQDGKDYIGMIGLESHKRVKKYVRRDYIVDGGGTLDKYTLLMAKVSGVGNFGETLSFGTVAEPGVGYLQTFIGIGKFDTLLEAQNVQKYIQTKFSRTMLGVLKATQDCPGPKWHYVPLQNFSDKSDIDWSQSIHDIDQQLYKKYGLDEKEIEFIETHVKEMD